LTGEPWKMLPWEFALLTDHQIIHCFLLPQIERDEESKRIAKGLPPRVDEDEVQPSGEPPNRQMMISMMVGMLGMSPQAAAEEYEAQRRLNEARKGKV
jgi:hypothetical protein